MELGIRFVNFNLPPVDSFIVDLTSLRDVRRASDPGLSTTITTLYS
jgi:hypothetical protein